MHDRRFLPSVSTRDLRVKIGLPKENATGSGIRPSLLPPCWAIARVTTSGPSSNRVEKISDGWMRAFRTLENCDGQFSSLLSVIWYGCYGSRI